MTDNLRPAVAFIIHQLLNKKSVDAGIIAQTVQRYLNNSNAAVRSYKNDPNNFLKTDSPDPIVAYNMLKGATKYHTSLLANTKVKVQDELDICEHLILVLMAHVADIDIYDDKPSIDDDQVDFQVVFDHSKCQEFYSETLPEVVKLDFKKSVPDLYSKVLNLDNKYTIYKPEILSKIMTVVFQHVEQHPNDAAAKNYAMGLHEHIRSLPPNDDMTQLLQKILSTIETRYGFAA